MRKLFLTWQDKKSRKWFPVGQLSFNDGIFRFLFVRGALEARESADFHPPVSFPDFEQVYESEVLFPIFANRVMSSLRPDYVEFVEYLNLPEDRDDPLAFLARTGGAKVTDSFQVFPSPKFENGEFHLHFFAHGLRYIPKWSIDRIGQLVPNEKLFLAHDFQNPVESSALQLHTKDNFIVGYCPSYLLDDVNELRESQDVEVLAERVNNGSSPLQFRLLCRLAFSAQSGHEPFSTGNYASIASKKVEKINAGDITFA